MISTSEISGFLKVWYLKNGFMYETDILYVDKNL